MSGWAPNAPPVTPTPFRIPVTRPTYVSAGPPPVSSPIPMPDAPTKLQRWLDVVAFLASHRLPVATDTLWSNVPAYARGVDGTAKEKRSVRRMFERDKKELRAKGIPIETVEFSINYGAEKVPGYRLQKADFHLPYLKLLREGEGEASRPTRGRAEGEVGRPTHGRTEGSGSRPTSGSSSHFELREDEAGAALDGLRELASIPSFPLARAARSAFRKLAFDLDPEAVSPLPVVYAEDPETASSRDALHALSDALRRRKRTTFRYRAMTSDEVDERRVHGYGLLFQHGRWYLVAWDLDREDMRMFRVGRMEGIGVNGKKPGTPDYAVPDDFALDDYAGRKAWELGAGEEEPGMEATVRFGFPRSLWAHRNGHGELVEEESDGAQTRRFVVHRTDPFLRWLLSLGGDARVTSPADLRQAFQSLARRVGKLHGERP